MNASAIAAFESTVQKSNEWVNEVMDEMCWDDPQRAYHGLRAVLHTLRDRLPLAEAVDLSSQLPMLVRGVYFEGWRPNRTVRPDRTKEEFLQHIFDAFPGDFEVDPEELVWAVFRVMARHITKGEIDDIKATLPVKFREFWPA
ncbi:hypothetical protein CA13_10020 [Planctomycetes bacterium CA13]|uniref:DUF2267 domain-containing protein n=1 Tax=Novipirellula herctigrandis TaxID=2527986 RepID=A0A5C5YX24_9BACT|nr:hypothetical protein CA13_10020 [Planctomycetes bacterium CA13]